MILDVYSRYVVGWMVAHREAAAQADRGTSMTSKPVAMLLSDLGVTKSYSRPRPRRQPLLREPVQDPQAPPDLPGPVRLDPARRAFCQGSFGWYNFEHHHSGIALLTLADVHYGRAEQVTSARAVVLEGADATHPERFVRKPPTPPQLPEAARINKPVDPTEAPQQFPA